MIGTKYSWLTDDELLSLIECRGFSDIHEVMEEITTRFRSALQETKPE